MWCYMRIQYVFEQMAVVLHGTPQILRCPLPAFSPDGYVVGGPVVTYDARVFHRNIRRLLLELAHRITASPQSLVHKGVSGGYSLARIVHELFLRRSPFDSETIAFFAAQSPDTKRLNSFLTRIEDRFRAPHAALPIGYAVVLRSELSLEFARLLALKKHHGGHGDRRHRDNKNYNR